MRKGPMLAACAAALAMPAAAGADTTVTARTLWRFDAPSYTLNAGERLLFHNMDALSPGPHNVTAEAMKDGKPLFASQTGGNGHQSEVVGSSTLTAGSYGFICTVHPFMRATLEVKAPPPPPPPPPDTTRPELSADLRSSSRAAVLKSGRLRLHLASDEPVRLAVTISAQLRNRVTSIARRFVFEHKGGLLALQIPVTGEGKTLLRTHKRLKVKVTLRGKDAAGNLATGRAQRTLR